MKHSAQKIMKKIHVYGLIVFLLLSCFPVSAQTGTGTVAGTVRDANQAIVVGAKVTLTNLDTNVSHEGTSSDEGSYFFGAIPRGQYALVVEAQGHKKWTGKLTLQVGQNAVIDVPLEVGAVDESVEVTSAAPLITPEGAQVADVKDYQRIRQLPLNGRNISALFNLTPGVESDPGGGSPRVNGLKVGSLEITVDGISIVDRFGGGIARVQPGLDTIQEFRLETVGSDARYSRPATVTLSTRSGTNQLHGSIFETHRNNASGLLARNRQQTQTVATFPKLIRNEFGGSAGGPIYIPKLYDGHNKSFFFVAYEGLRAIESNTHRGSVPTDAMWNGDFSNYRDSDGNLITLYDPLTTNANGVRQPFPNNIIPANRISAFAKLLRPLTAKPTNGTNPLVGENLFTFYPRTTDSDKLTVKGDHTFANGKDTLSARWTRTKFFFINGGQFSDPSMISETYGYNKTADTIHNVSVTYTHTFSNNLLNELLGGVHRSNKRGGTLADNTNWADRLGLPNPFKANGWPGVFGGVLNADTDNVKDEILNGTVFEDNVTWVKGGHTFTFGGKYRKEKNDIAEIQYAQGYADFNGYWTAQYDPANDEVTPFTGDGFANLLLGLPTELFAQYNRGFFFFRQAETGFYFSDKWKVSPRLTLSLGLRWDKWTPYKEKFNRLSAVDLNTALTKFQVVTPGSTRIQDIPGIPPSVLASWSARGLTYTTANDIGYPKKLFRADNNNFGPRLGAAFKINDKTVIRGGYGQYFWTMPLSQLLQASRTNPPLNLGFDQFVADKNDASTYDLVSRPSADDFVGLVKINTEGLVDISSRAQTTFLWDGRNWKDGRSHSVNLTLERELPFKTALRVSFIGTYGRDLEQRFSLNAPEAQYNYVARTGQAPPPNSGNVLRANPNWNFNAVNRTGYSNTNSGQVEVERRFANGLAFQWYYVYSRSLTTTDTDGFSSGNTSINSAGGGGAVPENQQLFGAPSLSYDQRLRLVYFNSTNVPPHRIRYNAIVDLPFGRGKKFGGDAPGWLNQVIGGWQVATIGDWRSGLWLSVNPSLYQFGDPSLKSSERVELTLNGVRYRLWFRGFFDPSSATNVTGGSLTNLVPVDRSQRIVRPLGPNFNNQLPQKLANGTTRNTPIGELYNPSRRAGIIGPGAWNLDLSLFKNFYFREKGNVRFTADFFNFLNHPNDVNPDPTTGLQNLTQQTVLGQLQPGAINSPRTIQLSLRIDW
ncbi:MAG: TonB-dependent receptor [Acidobacteria bacterium]|nr:TonB-dependent receptor [Acidobacteriota bacterium]